MLTWGNSSRNLPIKRNPPSWLGHRPMTTHPHTAELLEDKELLPKVGCGRVTVWLYLIKVRADQLQNGCLCRNYFCIWCLNSGRLFWNICSISGVWHFKIAWSPHAISYSDGFACDGQNHIIQFAPPFERTGNFNDWEIKVWNDLYLESKTCISRI